MKTNLLLILIIAVAIAVFAYRNLNLSGYSVSAVPTMSPKAKSLTKFVSPDGWSLEYDSRLVRFYGKENAGIDLGRCHTAIFIRKITGDYQPDKALLTPTKIHNYEAWEIAPNPNDNADLVASDFIIKATNHSFSFSAVGASFDTSGKVYPKAECMENDKTFRQMLQTFEYKPK